MGLVYAAEIVLRDVVRMRTQELVSTRGVLPFRPIPFRPMG